MIKRCDPPKEEVERCSLPNSCFVIVFAERHTFLRSPENVAPLCVPQVSFTMASTDRDLLRALTGVAGQYSWSTTTDPSTWYRIEVNDQGRVVELYLANSSLEGT